MRKLLFFLSMAIVAAFMSVNLTSCGGDDPIPAPTVQFLADIDPVDGYKVNITVQATDATSYTWDYGDGETSTQSGNHSYTYVASGSYTISVTVDNGEGLTASNTKPVTIVASIEEMIAGSTDAGKTWVLTKADGGGKMGVGHVDNSLAIIPGYDVIPANILAAFGLGGEYGDEFTFYKNGKYTTDNKNGKALASALYGGLLMQLGVTDVTMSSSVGQLPLSSVPMANITNGNWSLSYESFTTMAQNEMDIDPGNQVLEQKTFTFTEGETRVNLKLSSDAYIGFYDLTYPAIPGVLDQAVDNSFYIIKDVSPNAMHIAIASCGLSELIIYPTYMLHLTFVPK